jgi:hypothetical protein
MLPKTPVTMAAYASSGFTFRSSKTTAPTSKAMNIAMSGNAVLKKISFRSKFNHLLFFEVVFSIAGGINPLLDTLVSKDHLLKVDGDQPFHNCSMNF